MIANIKYLSDTIIVYGTLYLPSGKPNLSNLVIVRRSSDSLEMARTVTDKNGYFEIDLVRATLQIGSYKIEYYGTGVTQGGDWESFYYNATQGLPGAPGASSSYQGVYDPTITYYNTDVRRDVVQYSGSYYFCIATSGSTTGTN